MNYIKTKIKWLKINPSASILSENSHKLVIDRSKKKCYNNITNIILFCNNYWHQWINIIYIYQWNKYLFKIKGQGINPYPICRQTWGFLLRSKLQVLLYLYVNPCQIYELYQLKHTNKELLKQVRTKNSNIMTTYPSLQLSQSLVAWY